MFDVVIVGARCAGSPLANRLARAGKRVLLVDRAEFPSDTLSTHFLWPRGMSYLNRLGVAEQVLAVTPSARTINFTIESESFDAVTPLELLRERFARLHGNSEGVIDRYACIRRRLLDKILLDAAIEAGAEFRSGVTIEDTLREHGRVVGVRGRDRDGLPVSFRARLVVGADGRRSVVARSVGAGATDVHPGGSCAFWSYFSGLRIDTPTLRKRGELAMAIVPTNFDTHLTLVWGPQSCLSEFKRDLEGTFFRHLSAVSPEIGAQVREAGRREERFYGTAEQTAYRRVSAGPGWILAGDAASFKDQCVAIGITHALRDAELAAAAIARGWSGDLDAELARYAATRELDLEEHFRFACEQARMQPVTRDEQRLFRRIAADRRLADRFMAVYGDALGVAEFFGDLNQEEEVVDQEELALAHNGTEFAKPVGKDLLARTEDYYEWYRARLDTGTWQYSRALKSAPGPNARLYDEKQRQISGINFASQDYLALGQHPAVRETAIRALHDFGPHSAGSPIVIGNTELSLKLERELGEFLDTEHVVLFPTGWAAGYGTITGLVREYDHVVMDRLAHASLQAGVYAATRNVRRHEHLDVESAREHLRDIRSRDPKGGILVVSEGLFSMDADSPDLARLQAAAREFDATLFVDIAHDLGATGPGGTGQLGVQRLLGNADLVMGSFSKTFGSNGGFLATRSAAVKQYLKMYGNPHLFSNALSPVQTAVVREALRIVRSTEGEALRRNLLRTVTAMREEFARHGIACYGNPSPIVPVPIGSEAASRVAHRLLTERNVAAMIIEYPLVAIGAARFRLQAMANHSLEQGLAAARVISATIRDAHEYLAEREAQALPA